MADARDRLSSSQRHPYALSRDRCCTWKTAENYHLEKAIIHASKAAYIAKLIMLDVESIEKFENPMQIKDWEIREPMNSKLNKLKKSSPAAFFYWYKIYELTTQTK